jgi:SWI/SNF-related matrix-associated actin-dependent regulator of chromatin subfamily B protein 1
MFATLYCDDMELPAELRDEIALSIANQLDTFRRDPPFVPDRREAVVLVSLDILMNDVHIVDRFFWDLAEPRNSPEEFAASMVCELGLPTEFTPIVSFHIREALINAVREGKYVGEGGKTPSLELLRDKPEHELFRPTVVRLSADDREKLELARSREQRAKRRTLGTGTPAEASFTISASGRKKGVMSTARAASARRRM